MKEKRKKNLQSLAGTGEPGADGMATVNRMLLSESHA